MQNYFHIIILKLIYRR